MSLGVEQGGALTLFQIIPLIQVIVEKNSVEIVVCPISVIVAVIIVAVAVVIIIVVLLIRGVHIDVIQAI
jgi:hypothetical protein